MKKFSVILSSIFVLGTLSGCSGFLSPGEEQCACSGMPGSVYCHSARETYEKTNSGLVPSPIRTDSYNPDCTDCVRAEDVNPELQDGEYIELVQSPKRQQTDDYVHNYVTPAMPNHPIPIRTPSQVMRIWIGPYVDTNGDLIAPGYVYTEIEPRRWVYPEDSKALNNRVMTPLQDRSRFTNTESYETKGRMADEPEFSALQNYKRNSAEFLKTLTNKN